MQLKIWCCARPRFNTRKVSSVQNEPGWLYPNSLAGWGKVGHMTSLKVCCCLMNFPPHFSGKFDNKTNQSQKCFWQMVAGLAKYRFEVCYSFFLTLWQQRYTWPGLENVPFTSEIMPAQILIRITNATIFPVHTWYRDHCIRKHFGTEEPACTCVVH